MTVLGFGLNHKTAPFALLETVCFSPEAMTEFLGALMSADIIDEAFGLSTCNRTEFLLATSNAQQAQRHLIQLLNQSKGVDLNTHTENTFSHLDDHAMRHIFQVASGIDSLVVGENEILGQLRRAREAASDAGYIGAILDPLLIHGIDIGRRVRRYTTISRGNVSVASVATNLASRIIGDLSTKKAVVLGAGKTAEAAAFQLQERGLKDLTIINRTIERAQKIAKTLGAREATLAQLGQYMIEADIVICAVAAPHFIITPAIAQSAMNGRPNRPMLLLDISVPRNIDPSVNQVQGVHLHSLEDITQLADENRAQREAQMLEVEAMIDQEIALWNSQHTVTDQADAIAALHRQLEQIRRDYVARSKHHFPHENQQDLETFSAGLTRALLHDLVKNLREMNLDTPEGRHRFELAAELLNIPTASQPAIATIDDN